MSYFLRFALFFLALFELLFSPGRGVLMLSRVAPKRRATLRKVFFGVSSMLCRARSVEDYSRDVGHLYRTCSIRCSRGASHLVSINS